MNSQDQFLDQILNEAPSSETLFLLLKKRKEEGRRSEVIRECLKALERYPRDARIRGLLAEACFESGWISRAEAEVEAATARIEELIPLYKLKARVYAALNRREDAIKSLEIYLAHDPGDAESISLIEEMKPQRDSSREPVDSGQAAIEEAPLSLPEIATPTLAELYFAQGQIQEAVSTYEKILARNPEAGQFRTRLEELRAMVTPAPPRQEEDDRKQADDQTAARLRMKKEKMIHVLQSWRDSLREPMKGGVVE